MRQAASPRRRGSRVESVLGPPLARERRVIGASNDHRHAQQGPGREPDQRHPQGGAAVDRGRAYRHHQLRRAPDRRGDGQDELHQPRPRPRHRHLQPDARRPDCSVILVIAGSTSAGGCMDLYAELVRSNMVDAIVATGATIVDMDFFEALGHKHYQALEIPDDDTLRSLYIDRIYDTYIDEIAAAGLRLHHRQDRRQPRAASLFEPRLHPRDGQVAGRSNGKKDNSLVKLAYEHDVPIFCPAFTDSLGRLRPRQASGRCDEARRPLHDDGLDRRLPRADRHQDQGRHHRPADDRRRRARRTSPRTPWCAPKSSATRMSRCTNMRSRSPSPTSATAPAPPRRSRKRRAGARSRPRWSRWCSPRRPRCCRCSPATPITAATGRTAPSARFAKLFD